MSPQEIERQRNLDKLLRAILEEVRVVKEYVLEIRKSQSQRAKQIEEKNI